MVEIYISTHLILFILKPTEIKQKGRHEYISILRAETDNWQIDSECPVRLLYYRMCSLYLCISL